MSTRRQLGWILDSTGLAVAIACVAVIVCAGCADEALQPAPLGATPSAAAGAMSPGEASLPPSAGFAAAAVGAAGRSPEVASGGARPGGFDASISVSDAGVTAAPDSGASHAQTEAGAAGAAGSAPNALGVGACSGEAFMRALRIELPIAWPGTVGLEAGSGTMLVYSKSRFVQVGDAWVVEGRPCGSQLPLITTTAVLDHLKTSNEIPAAAFDSPNMPTYSGTITRSTDAIAIDPGAGTLGVELPAIDAVWPEASALVSVDHDADGYPGVSAIPLRGEGYLTPPTSVSQLQFADRVFVASRARFTLHAPAASCQELQAGTVEPLSFDFEIIGCRVEGGAACIESETRFIARQGPGFELQPGGTWSARELSEDASCAEVRAAFGEP